MHRITESGSGARRSRALRSGTLLTALAFALAGCNELIDVEAPSRVIANTLEDPANASLLLASVGADLECALGHYVVAGGLVGNELEIGTTLIVMKEYDKRDFNPFGSVYALATCEDGFSVGVYKPLSIARWQADNLLSLLDGWTDAEVEERTRKIAAAGLYSGFAHVLLGEGMCSVAFDLGPEVGPDEAFTRAEERFSRAISAAQSSNDDDLLAAAYLGRARAYARAGNLTAAATDAAQVPQGFVFNATYGTQSSRRENPVWDRNVRDRGFTIDPSYVGLSFGGVADPRVTLVNTGTTASDGETPLWHQTKYPDVSAPIPLATWEEAQLILAEAALSAGQIQDAVDRINALHNAVGLPAFAGGSAAEVRAQLIEERQRELFLESHHLGDIRQYDIPLTPAPGVPFKDGGGTYQDQTCFPLPDNERLNNPNIS